MKSRFTKALALAVTLPLLLAKECGPFLTPPEKDAVLMTAPAIVEELSRDHKEILTLLRAEDDAVRIDADWTAFVQFQGLRRALPGIHLLEWAEMQEVSHERCPSPPKCTRFLFSVKEGSLSSPSIQRAFLVAFVDEGVGRVVALDPQTQFNEQSLTVAITRFINDMIQKAGAYSEAASAAREGLLGKLIGCPEGATPTETRGQPNEASAYWCEKGAQRHGPFIKGHLSETLEGVRMEEGQYTLGKMDGTWTWRAPDGTVLRTEQWVDGAKRPEARPTPP